MQSLLGNLFKKNLKKFKKNLRRATVHGWLQLYKNSSIELMEAKNFKVVLLFIYLFFVMYRLMSNV